MNTGLFWVLTLFVMIGGAAAQMLLQSRFRRYGAVRLSSGLTGREVAEKMLRDAGINNVQVLSTTGRLTDHYNPANKTIRLSEVVYDSNSVAAAAVAAHETGHAIQDALGYAPLRLRSTMVPVVSFAGSLVQWVLLAGILLIRVFPGLLLFGIVLFGVTTLFSLITLPVEIDASRRALEWLRTSGVTSSQQQPMATSALKAAAYTYVVAALGSLVTLLYYLSIYTNNRR